MTATIPENELRRLVSGMPTFNILSEEDIEVVVPLLRSDVLDGEWLVEFGNDGKAVKYLKLDVVYHASAEAVISAIKNFVADRLIYEDDAWWIGIIPLKDWRDTIKDEEILKRLDPPDKLEVFTYEQYNTDGPMFNWTTPHALCKRLVDMGEISNINIVSRFILRSDLEARPTMPFVSDYVREAFNIAPYRYWKRKETK